MGEGVPDQSWRKGPSFEQGDSGKQPSRFAGQ